MDAKKEGRCDMFDQTNVGKERGMPIEDDDDDGDFEIVASISTNFRNECARLFFAFNAISLKYAIMQHR